MRRYEYNNFQEAFMEVWYARTRGLNTSISRFDGVWRVKVWL